MDHEECERLGRDMREMLEELGTLRAEGDFKVLCPVCGTWCRAELHPDEQASLVLGTMDGQNVVQIHAGAVLHCHDHECLVASSRIREMAEAGADGTWRT